MTDDFHGLTVDVLAVAQTEHLQLRGPIYEILKQVMRGLKWVGLVFAATVECDLSPQ